MTTKRKKTTKRVSPMKGRKISEEERKPDDPKLGRSFMYGAPSQKHVVTLSLPEGMMTEFLEKLGTDSQARGITMLIHKVLGKKMPKKKSKKKATKS